MIGLIVFCLAIAFILYFTVGASLSDFHRQLSQLQSDEIYGNIHKLVSAGSAEKTYKEAVVRIEGGSFVNNGEKVNADRYTIMVVDGNSMSRFGIEDGGIVFVDEEDISLSRTKDTFFVLKIDNWGSANKIEYKLRKAIDFYDCICEDRAIFDVWVKNHPELNAGELYEKYEKEYAKIEECKRFRCRLLVSETTRDGKPYYSFHPEKYIYGKVKYKIPKEKVKIIEKR
jgi:hypothetical protein